MLHGRAYTSLGLGLLILVLAIVNVAYYQSVLYSPAIFHLGRFMLAKITYHLASVNSLVAILIAAGFIFMAWIIKWCAPRPYSRKGILTILANGSSILWISGIGVTYSIIFHLFSLSLLPNIYYSRFTSNTETWSVSILFLVSIGGGLPVFLKFRKAILKMYERDLHLFAKEICQLAHTKLNKGNLEEAIYLFEVAVVEFPNDPTIWKGLGEAYLDTMQWQESQLAMTIAAELTPNDLDIWRTIQELRQRRGERKSFTMHDANRKNHRSTLILTTPKPETLLTILRRRKIATRRRRTKAKKPHFSARSIFRHYPPPLLHEHKAK